MKTEHQVLTGECCTNSHHSHICWSAVFAGGFVGLGLGFLLHLFGMAIGLSAYSANPDGTTMLAVGGLIGMIIGVIISMGAAGYVAGYLGKCHSCVCHGGIVYGFVTWSLALVLSAILVMPLMHYMASYKQDLLANVVPISAGPNTSTQAGVTKHHPEKAVTDKTIAPVVAPTDLIWSSWVIFVLFFIGTLSSCMGASYAMCCKKKKEASCIS